MNKWRYDRKLTAMMIEDFIHNPVLAAKVILGLKIPPQQEIRIVTMWVTHQTQDDSGFSTAKSTTHAIVAALRSVLFKNRISGIVSGTFRQGKLIFANLERWSNSSSIFRNQLQVRKGQLRFVHGNDAWEATFKSGSTIRALPPNFTEDSTALQSERWNDGYFDEWRTFSVKALTKTLIGRCTAYNENIKCPIRMNHVHICGTAGVESEPHYSIVKKVDDNINSGNKNYAHITFNYRHVPKTEEWSAFIDRRAIYTMQTLNPRSIVGSEVDGLWQKEGLSYYSSKEIDKVRFISRPERVRSPDSKIFYVGGFDTARGGSGDNTQSAYSDDFSFTVLKGDPSKDYIPQHVLTYRMNNVTAEQMSGIIHYINPLFYLSTIVFDTGGGGLFVKDELKKPVAYINGSPHKVTPIVEKGDVSSVLGNEVLVPFLSSNRYIRKAWGNLPGLDYLVNKMHTAMKARLQNGKIYLMRKSKEWEKHLTRPEDPDHMRSWLNKNAGIDFENKIKLEGDLAATQLGRVDVERDKEGKPLLNRNNQYKFLSKHKKDSAYSLCYALTAYEVHMSMQEIGEYKKDSSGNSKFAISVSDTR